MGVSLEELWKGAGDEALVDAAAKWNALNDEGRRVVLAEAERRGLNLNVPNGNGAGTGNAATASASSAVAGKSTVDIAAAVNMKIWLLVGIVVAAVAAIAVFT